MSGAFERRYFKLPTGYMHVDEHGLAFTRSGNWSEVAMVKERRTRMPALHLVRVVLGVALVGTGIVFYAVLSLHLKGAIAFVIALAGAAWKIHRYISGLQDDMAQAFRIPFAKVRSVSSVDGRLAVNFVNGAWKEDEVSVMLDPAQAEWVKAVWDSRRG